ncbi:hypothetical protein Tco_1438166 [Tanacetum coccineum]
MTGASSAPYRLGRIRSMSNSRLGQRTLSPSESPPSSDSEDSRRKRRRRTSSSSEDTSDNEDAETGHWKSKNKYREDEDEDMSRPWRRSKRRFSKHPKPPPMHTLEEQRVGKRILAEIDSPGEEHQVKGKINKEAEARKTHLETRLTPTIWCTMAALGNEFYGDQINHRQTMALLEDQGSHRITEIPIHVPYESLKFPIDAGIRQHLNQSDKLEVADSYPDYPERRSIDRGGRCLILVEGICVRTSLQRNLDIFAWEPKHMTGVPRSITEHKLKIRQGYSPSRSQKSITMIGLSQPSLWSKRAMEAGRMCVDFMTFNKAMNAYKGLTISKWDKDEYEEKTAFHTSQVSNAKQRFLLPKECKVPLATTADNSLPLVQNTQDSVNEECETSVGLHQQKKLSNRSSSSI